MASKLDLKKALQENKPNPPKLRRGVGFTLSTEVAVEEKEPESKSVVEEKRVRNGMQIKPSIIREYKKLAVEERRHMYMLVEEALTEYLARKRKSSS